MQFKPVVIPNCGFWQVRRVNGVNPARPSEACVEPSELPIIQDCFGISNFANRSFDYDVQYETLKLRSRIKRDSTSLRTLLLLFRVTEFLKRGSTLFCTLLLLFRVTIINFFTPIPYGNLYRWQWFYRLI